MALKPGPKRKTDEGKDDRRQRNDNENKGTQKKPLDLKTEKPKKN